MHDDTITDSDMSLEAALAQNPASIAPPDVLAALSLIEVAYTGFDGKLHEGRIVMHRAVADDVREFFAHALELRFPVKKAIPIAHPGYAFDDERSCADNNSSGYNYRLIAGTDRLSKHARGLAFDVNPVQNPFIQYAPNGAETFRFPPQSIFDPAVPGTLTSDHSLVRFLKERGWVWGGDWTAKSGRTDYQHFEKDLAT